MKKLLFLLLPILLSATTVETLVQKALSQHISLEVIQERLNAEEYQISASRNFYNPEISFAINDIQFDDITDRSRERMQTTSVNIKQKIPSFGKRDAATQKNKAIKRQLMASLDEAKVALAKEIKVTAYSIWNLAQELNITKEYIEITRQNIELNTAYSATRNDSHMGIMSAELTLSQLKLKKIKFESLQKGMYAKLAYLVGEKVQDLELSLVMQKPQRYTFYQSQLSNNRTYITKKQEMKVAAKEVKVQDLSGDVDPYVQVGYFYRQEYKDYLNVSFGMALPIYGSETDNTESARKLVLSKSAAQQDYLLALEGQLGGLYAQLEDSYAVYEVLHSESMPQIEHMFELTNASVKNGQDLFVYIDLLKQKLALDEQLITATTKFYITQASLDALIGVSQ